MISRLVFLLPPKINIGSTYLRGDQLFSVSKEALKKNGFESRIATDFDISDSAIIINKVLARDASAKILRSLKRKNNVLCLDPLDAKIKKEVLDEADLLIASSFTQQRWLKDEFPKKQVLYVGHHVDLRIGIVAPPIDQIRIGYFGELFNAKYVEELAHLVDFHAIDNRAPNHTDWIQSLSKYNVHYGIRQYQASVSHKPFTKGLIAAHCGAPILISSEDEESSYFLPADYPYRLSDTSLDGLKDAIVGLTNDFGSPRWLLAKDMMNSLKPEFLPQKIAEQVLRVAQVAQSFKRSRFSFFRF